MIHLFSDDSGEVFVEYAVEIGALEFPPAGRVMKSKRLSPYFFNSGLFSSGHSLSRLALACIAAVQGKVEFDVIFGPAYKGIPIATAMALAIGGNMGYAFDRKEEKDHGEGGLLVGADLAGKNVLLVDDVATTGKTKRAMFEFVRKHRGNPIACVIGFDREELGEDMKMSAAQEFQHLFGIPMYAAGRLTDLISYLKKQGSKHVDILAKVLAYQRQYGTI